MPLKDNDRKRRLQSEGAMAPIGQALIESDPSVDPEVLQKMAEQRETILKTMQARLDHPLMDHLAPLQKEMMMIEMKLGAGFALAALGLPLGAVFLREAQSASLGMHQKAGAMGAQNAGTS